MLRKTYHWWAALSLPAFIIVTSLVSLLAQIVFLIPAGIFYEVVLGADEVPLRDVGEAVEDASGLLEIGLVIILLVPFLETWVFQSIVIRRIQRHLSGWLRPRTNLGALLASTVLFAGTHWFSLVYMWVVIPAGLILGQTYILFQTRKPGSEFWITFVLHAIRNALAFVAFVFPWP